MGVNIFVYGTLMFPEVVKDITGKSFAIEDAVLHGYIRLEKLPKWNFMSGPAIIQRENTSVEGKVLIAVDDKSLEIFDFFEGSEYVRRHVTVLVGNNGMEVMVYFASEELKHRLGEVWDPKIYKETSLEIHRRNIIPEFLKELRKQNG